MDKDEQTIRREWSTVLQKHDCIEIYEFLYSVILNEEYPLDQKLVLDLLHMALESDLPCEAGPYGNLKEDIGHYTKVYSEKT
ncbi:MAG: hypothetical protein HPY61_05195 [Methanotrichaceae archaeon]|nr:hypothetical protein [Methanotrichaceae archaeon]